MAPTTIVTDASEIRRQALTWGATVIYDPSSSNNGTERVAKVADGGIILQGDEPLITPDSIYAFTKFVDEMRYPRVIAACEHSGGPNDRNDVKITEVLVNRFWGHGEVRGFSRDYGVLEVLGLSYFKNLSEYPKQPRSDKPSKVESIEQLRWLEHGIRLEVLPLPWRETSVDTEEDLRRVEQCLSSLTSMAS